MISPLTTELSKPLMPGLTPDQLKGRAGDILEGTHQLRMFDCVMLHTDETGAVEFSISNNLRRSFESSLQLEQDPIVLDRCAQMLALWVSVEEDQPGAPV